MMNTNRCLKYARSLLGIAGLVISFFALGPVSTQVAQGRIAYMREAGSYNELVMFVGADSRIRIPSNSCYEVSPDVRYAATVSANEPRQLFVCDLTTGYIKLEMSAEATWTFSCDFFWSDNYRIAFIQSRETNQIYELDVELSTFVGSIIHNQVPQLPDINPESSLVLPSPDSIRYVYELCDLIIEGSDGAFCGGNTQQVIFDVESQVVTSLPNVAVIPTRPVDPQIFFAWSNSDDRLAYAATSTLINVYETEQMTYVDMSFLNTLSEVFLISPSGIRWAPNDQLVGIWAYSFDVTSRSFVHSFAAVNLSNQTTKLFPVDKTLVPEGFNNWSWLPSGEGIIVATRDGELIAISQSGEQTFIDEGISRIYSWYMAVTSSPSGR